MLRLFKHGEGSACAAGASLNNRADLTQQRTPRLHPTYTLAEMDN